MNSSEISRDVFVTCQQSHILKEAGFDWPCQAYYNRDSAPDGHAWLEVGVHCVNRNMRDNMFSAPTQAVATRWLRDVSKLSIRVNYSQANRDWFYDILDLDDDSYFDGGIDDYYSTYEDALSAGIDEALELLKEKMV